MSQLQFGATHFFVLPRLVSRADQKKLQALVASGNPKRPIVSRTIGPVQVIDTGSPSDYKIVDYEILKLGRSAFARFRRQTLDGKLPWLHLPKYAVYGPLAELVSYTHLLKRHAVNYMESLIPKSLIQRVKETRLAHPNDQDNPFIQIFARPGFYYCVQGDTLTEPEQNAFAARLAEEVKNVRRFYGKADKQA